MDRGGLSDRPQHNWAQHNCAWEVVASGMRDAKKENPVCVATIQNALGLL
jgi:hypothetical protein